jgi:hypothetical protein
MCKVCVPFFVREGAAVGEHLEHFGHQSGFGGVSMCVQLVRVRGAQKWSRRRTNCSIRYGSEDGRADEAKEDEAADDGVVYSDLLVVGVSLRRHTLQVREQAPNEPKHAPECNERAYGG